MQNIRTQADLKMAIQELQAQRLIEKDMLREQFQSTYQSLKPFNLFKHAVQEIAGSKDIKNDILQTGIGLTTGLLSKSLFIGSSHSVIKQVLGTALQMGVTSLVTSTNPSALKNIGNKILKFLKK